jgi:hypothetical protein
VHDLLSTGRSLLYVSFVTNLKSNSCSALTTLYTTQKSFFTLHALNNSAIQLKLFLTGLVTSKGRSGHLCSNHCQRQIQKSHSLSALNRRKGEPQSHSRRIPAPKLSLPNLHFECPVRDLLTMPTEIHLLNNVARINRQLALFSNL